MEMTPSCRFMCSHRWRHVLWSLLFLAVLHPVHSRKRINYSPLEMSRSEIISYFRSVYQAKASSFDRANEQLYLEETFLEDLYSKIDNLMPLRNYVKFLMKTKNITDKSDGRGASQLESYVGHLNGKCARDTVFNRSLEEILLRWDGDRISISNDIDTWHERNTYTAASLICNRFRGLSCQLKVSTGGGGDGDTGKQFEVSMEPTCQCDGDSTQVGFFRKVRSSGRFEPYPDGCYVRPWKRCSHLSMDTAFPPSYSEWHRGLENVRSQLAQMVFPVGRSHRCKEGTYCLDLVPGNNKPICWCNERSSDPTCKALEAKTHSSQETVFLVGNELAKLRKKFVKLIIPANDSMSTCQPEWNEDVVALMGSAGLDPTKNGSVGLMHKMAYSEGRSRICDFRKSFICSPKTKTCLGNLNCEPGKIHLGFGVCAVDNGFRCQSSEECVELAKCKRLPGLEESACVCEAGYYGAMCKFQKGPFFGSRLLPILSGAEGERFVKMQMEVYEGLEGWEDNMKGRAGEPCDPAGDTVSMDLVQYFGNLAEYNEERGRGLLSKVKEVLQRGVRLCYYTKFLRCEPSSLKCVPLMGDKVLAGGSDGKISVEINPGRRCMLQLPKLFEGTVSFRCVRGYTCGRANGSDACLPDCNSVFAPKKYCGQDGVVEEYQLEDEVVDEKSKKAGGRKRAKNAKVKMSKEGEGNQADEEENKQLDLLGVTDETTKGLESEEINGIEDAGLSESGQNIEAPIVDSTPETDGMGASEEDNGLQSETEEAVPEALPTIDSIPETGGMGEDEEDNGLQSGTEEAVPPSELEDGNGEEEVRPFNTINDDDINQSTDNTTGNNTTTVVPITGVPTTEGTTTVGPTTEGSTTVGPTTEGSTTVGPTTASPTTVAPTGVPTTVVPTGVPTTGGSTGSTSGNTSPIGNATTTEFPETLPPATTQDYSLVDKQSHLQSCLYNDDRILYPPYEKRDICDAEKYLICEDRICQCFPGLMYSENQKKCVVPIGDKCQEHGISLPSFMDAESLTCEYGICRMDNVGKICRPASDSGLILIHLEHNSVNSINDVNQYAISAGTPVAHKLRRDGVATGLALIFVLWRVVVLLH